MRFLKELEKLGLDENTKPNIQIALKYDMKLDDSIKTEINNGFSFRENPHEIPLNALKAQIFLNNYPLKIKTLDFMYNNALTNLRQGYNDIHINYFTNSNESKKFIRKELQDFLNINPLKEFGTNYAEFYRDGQGAVKKLLAEKQGQVAGAFYRDDLAKATGTGEIDLVWGDSTKGLQHILEHRAADFKTQGLTKEQAEQKALWFVENDLNDIIRNGNISFSKVMNRVFFDTDTQKAVIALDYDGKDRKWVLTAFNKNDKGNTRSLKKRKSPRNNL